MMSMVSAARGRQHIAKAEGANLRAKIGSACYVLVQRHLFPSPLLRLPHKTTIDIPLSPLPFGAIAHFVDVVLASHLRNACQDRPL